MSAPLRFFRHMLFLPHGDPQQQARDIQKTEDTLRSGRHEVTKARESVEKAYRLRQVMNELLTKLHTK